MEEKMNMEMMRSRRRWMLLAAKKALSLESIHAILRIAFVRLL